MKNKPINNLMLAGLLAPAIAGCSLGSNGQTDGQTNLMARQASITTNLPNVINMIGDDIIDSIVDPSSGIAQMGTQLLGLITGKTFPTRATPSQLQQLEAQNAQMFAQIQSNLQSINSKLNAQGTLLLDIQNSIYQDQQIDTQLAISSAQNQLQTMLSNLNSYIAITLPTDQANQINALLNNAESGTIPESAVTTLVKDTGVLVSRVPGINGGLDNIEITLAGDNATPYSVNNPSIHSNPESYGTVSNTQLIASLQAAYNAYVSQSNNSSNFFKNQLAWDNTVDSTILNLLQSLNTAYRIDQLRLYLSMNPKTQISPPTSIYYGDLSDYATASADLTYAYQQRSAFLMYLDNLYKTNFWNNFIATLGTNLAGVCNLNNLYLASLNDASSLGSWNGTNLTISCSGGTIQSQGQAIESVINTNFTPSLACSPNSDGTYSDLMVTKAGYIICGTNANDWNVNFTYPGNARPTSKNLNGYLTEAALNGTYAANIAHSQYSWAYLFVPLAAYTLGTMQVSLPDYNNGITSFTEIGGYYSGIWGITGAETLGSVMQNVQSIATGSFDGTSPINILTNYYEPSVFDTSMPVVYYDSYHALLMQATCATEPGAQGHGCGIAVACIPGLSDCTNAAAGSTATLAAMNLSVTRSNDSIQFANGDMLQLSLTSINQPNNAGLAIIQYSN